MNTQIFSVHDHPLSPEDLNVCKATFDRICAAQRVHPETDKASDLAALVIELYRQGVRDHDQLAAMIGTVGEP